MFLETVEEALGTTRKLTPTFVIHGRSGGEADAQTRGSIP
jgi:hypothetical protein